MRNFDSLLALTQHHEKLTDGVLQCLLKTRVA